MKRIARAYNGVPAVLIAMFLLVACTTTADPVRQRAARPPTPTREWARGAVFYEIFVRSFYDSNNDGIGDFPGLTSKLDYLSTLGVDGVWLMPVQFLFVFGPNHMITQCRT
jgi:pullulanase/glycogen debranching enzyme